MKTLKMNSIFAKALMNGFLGWILIALFTCAMHSDISLGQAFTALPNICAGIAAGIGSYIGYMMKRSS